MLYSIQSEIEIFVLNAVQTQFDGCCILGYAL